MGWGNFLVLLLVSKLVSGCLVYALAIPIANRENKRRARRDSNPRPSHPKCDALSTELRAHECSLMTAAAELDTIRIALQSFFYDS